ncbi:MAG: hypothetical protein NVS3B10_06950 [Polyangiales bacterium]
MAEVLASDELIDEPSDHGSLQPGTRLGRYELLVPIARGGMARVWAARLHGQRGFQKLVAIKTILPHLAEEAEFERMFLDEARIASGVHHPNVCEIYELGEEKRTLYLVMEWVNGDSLARVLRATGKTEAVDPRVVARVVADACAGLHAAHELTDEDGRSLGVVHRDLSPHNILLTADGTTKVADFGVAKALGQLHEATSAGQLKGKIAYMAPEQVTGAAIDRRSDVFSLGCVLYEATTGQRPFRGDGDHQVMHAVLKGEFPAPSLLLRHYPQELERIIMRALSAQPILRYPTAERMRFALEEFLARGQLVTQSNVAQVVRARIGEQIDRRKERIRQASSAGDGEVGWSEPPGGMTPSNQAREAAGGHQSGVKASGAHAAKSLYTTMQMAGAAPPGRIPGPPPPGVLARDDRATAPMGGAESTSQPLSSTTIPHAAPHPYPMPDPVLPSYPWQDARAPHGPPPPAKFAQTALMPETAGDLAQLTNAPMRPFTIPPTSSSPPGAMQPPMQHPELQQQPVHQRAMHQPALHPSQPLDPRYPPPPVVHLDAPVSGGVRPSSAPAGTGQYVIAIAIGVLLAALIGAGGFVAIKHRHAAVEVDSGDTEAVPKSSSIEGTPAATTVTPTPARVEIQLRITPARATLSVDGRELASDARTLTRPAMGKSVTVVAHASGYEDATVLVDFFTTSPLEIALKPLPAAVDEAPKDPSPPKDPPKKRVPKSDPALPPNPF